MSHVMAIHSDQADYEGILLYICIITMKNVINYVTFN